MCSTSLHNSNVVCDLANFMGKRNTKQSRRAHCVRRFRCTDESYAGIQHKEILFDVYVPYMVFDWRIYVFVIEYTHAAPPCMQSQVRTMMIEESADKQTQPICFWGMFRIFCDVNWQQ